MKRLRPLLLLLLAAGCTSTSSSSSAAIVGSHDLVLVDQLPGDGGLARQDGTEKGGAVVGMPSRYLFVTSADSNELRVLQLWRPAQTGRDYLRAPNPLETLSIPVIDRPTQLVVDEGLEAGTGRRVTGSYLYAARPGAAEISIVSATGFRQVTSRPLTAPAPLTALAAFMGADLSALPASTGLFVATWDGQRGAVFRYRLPTDEAALREKLSVAGGPQVAAERVLDLGGEVVTALAVVPPLAGRALDGTAFCDTSACLAVATRRDRGAAGQTLLVDPDTGRSAALAYPGPVRDFAAGARAARLFALLDEDRCGGPTCGGVSAVDLHTGVQGAFPLVTDFSGQPMQPIQTGNALPTGLTVADGVQLRQTTPVSDAGSTDLAYLLQTYELLGAVAASNGEITFFDGTAATVIDYDGRRSTVSGTTVRVPGVLPDGGLAFTNPFDGGALGSTFVAVVAMEPAPDEQPWRVAAVSAADAGVGQRPLQVDLSDGYFASQDLVIAFQGQVPGFVDLPTTAADAERLPVTAGLEGRVAVGDLVRFERGAEPCGGAVVSAVEAGALRVDAVPAACAERTRFSVRAGGARPYVVAATLEGYLGRAGQGAPLTWEGRQVAFPWGYQGPRPALRVTVGDVVPQVEGAFATVSIEGRLVPYRLAVDTVNVCNFGTTSQVVWGNLALAQVPTAVSTQAGPAFQWRLWGALPTVNGTAEIDPLLAYRGTMGIGDGVICRR